MQTVLNGINRNLIKLQSKIQKLNDFDKKLNCLENRMKNKIEEHKKLILINQFDVEVFKDEMETMKHHWKCLLNDIELYENAEK